MNFIKPFDLVKNNLLNACDRRDFNKVKEVVNNLPNISAALLNEILCDAATYNLEAVRYLLTSPELICHPDVNSKGYNILYNAGNNEKLDIVKYLLTSPELKTHALVHDNEDMFFTHMCGLSRYSVVKYLILDYGIERTELIDGYLKKYSHPNVEHMFEMQKLNKELNGDMIVQPTTNKPTKI